MSKRVALLTHSFFSGGGTAVVTKFLHTVLRTSKRYEPEIISLATSISDSASVRLLAPKSWLGGPQLQSGIWQGLPYRHIGAVLTEFEFQRYRPRPILTDILNQYDLVQVIGGTPAWAWVAHRTKRPLCIFTATSITRDRASRLLKERGARRLWLRAMTKCNVMIEKRALHHADTVFTESIYTYNNLKEAVQPPRLLIGKPGIDVDFFRPVKAKKQTYILAVGRFSDPRKNVRLLFNAYKLMSIKNHEVPTLALAGTPPLPKDLDYMVSLGIHQKIKLYQEPSQEELAELYRNALFFVLSSDEEGLGIVILEAMASGVPVISTDCGGPATAVVRGETGFLTPVGDAQALAEAMERLLRDPQLQEYMGKAGRQVAEEKFSLSVTGKVYLDRFDELLAERR